jgi:2-dehydro-3-deoxygluconokinase
MKRAISVGEIMLRLSPPGQERFFQSPELRTCFGGSEANVAVSLAHFGLRSEYVTRLPSNPIGDAALRALRAEGVGVEGIMRGGSRLGIYYVEPGADIRPMRVIYDRAGSSFSQLDPAEIDWRSLLRGADWLHLSGITPALGDAPARAAQDAALAARALGVTVSVDLNYRPALWAGRDPAALIRPLAGAADVIIGNPAAVDAMLGIRVDEAPAGGPKLDVIAGRVHADLGCRQIAMTHREVLSSNEHGWRAALYDAGSKETHFSRRYQVRLADRVGGGDSFAAALVFAILTGRAAADTIAFATAASALKLTIPGDFNRVSVEEVDRLLQTTA